MPLAESHRLRRGRFSEPGRLYMLTTVTYQRQPLFHDFHHARLVVKHLRVSHDIRDCHSLAWVVMPDHLHWLIELRDVTLGTLMRKFKSRTAIALRKAGLGHTRIWQPGYQDHALRREESLVHVARYIVANPLRAGLVRSVRDYPHWDAVWL
ncbi:MULTISPECIES: transposase [unclassified Pseudomonas]|uniref:REP-associated tyrosine transposase n=1 Tax=Pseudomonas TaxID=286 RepID=UPI000D8F5D07|nr:MULTISPECIES: transposase [unclassified Pseudomonas]MDR2319936.1 transposase [Pseudomonas sp.]PYG76385.1 REP element-mobilizing transposase RayT [Pseudomonas sp. RV120224-01c]PYG79915.1 REP element-mobilizing transposase RayT [Pseudomonas sp. RV120224-01b]